MQSVEINYLREIARECYTGGDFENALRKGAITTASYLKKISQKLKEKLGEKHGDRIYTGRTLNKGLNLKLQGALKSKSKILAIDVEYTIKSNKRPRNDPIVDYDSDVSSNDETMEQNNKPHIY